MNSNDSDMKSEHKDGEKNLQAFLDIFNNVLGSFREAMILLDRDLKVIKASDSFYTTFMVTRKKTEGSLIYDLGNRQWDIPRLRELLENILPHNSVFNDFEVEHKYPKSDIE